MRAAKAAGSRAASPWQTQKSSADPARAQNRGVLSMQPDASVAKNTDTHHTPPTGKVVVLRETPTPRWQPRRERCGSSCRVGAESRLGAHVPATWPLSARYNGSLDSSEEWGLNVASQLASHAPRPRNAAVAFQYSGSLDMGLPAHYATTRINPFCYLGGIYIRYTYILIRYLGILVTYTVSHARACARAKAI